MHRARLSSYDPELYSHDSNIYFHIIHLLEQAGEIVLRRFGEYHDRMERIYSCILMTTINESQMFIYIFSGKKFSFVVKTFLEKFFSF